MRCAEYDGPVELRAMQSLAERVGAVNGFRMVGDLAWSAALAHESVSPTAVWRDEDDVVVAWAWLESEGSLAAQVDPARPELAGEVLDWAANLAGGSLRTEVCETEAPLIAALESRGYVPRPEPFLLCLEHDLDGVAAPVAPAGYVIRAVRGVGDFERRAAVHRAAFGSERMTARRYGVLAGAWPYRAEFDLIAEAPDGTFAAYCLGWYDPVNRIGEFEPVGTHPDHRRRGLARAVCAAALRAFAEAGAERAVVYARGDDGYPVPRRLYRSLGFTPYASTVTYASSLS
ncbi:GNAT family N-acetyltransferase [Bailinhaonella thermotolerans]|uniref:GNAT family N-acetyltransferase n=1 Tax=Bailinhaonella thermotolerans TaxID=1070861 RepID=A0A3A4BFG8_9ACTN|nr:GNAT family N-acetyltransferase [Bailinhaonella thermotolerans]RJL33222.1 GNAT family N-acetyltransferase [Bailinhaonella thermotolerans]